MVFQIPGRLKIGNLVHRSRMGVPRRLPGVAAWITLLLGGCMSGSQDDAQGRTEPYPLEPDSIVADLFSLNAALRLREDRGVLTPRGEARLVDLGPDLDIGEELVFRTSKHVRTYSAYAFHERDLHCDGHYSGDSALLILFDDGKQGLCHDTAFAWIPSYPYRVPVTASYLEGKGFWISAGQLDFAIGKLIIHFDHHPKRE
jgi:hypothetical protein